jgi:chromosome segregation ATPase
MSSDDSALGSNEGSSDEAQRESVDADEVSPTRPGTYDRCNTETCDGDGKSTRLAKNETLDAVSTLRTPGILRKKRESNSRAELGREIRSDTEDKMLKVNEKLSKLQMENTKKSEKDESRHGAWQKELDSVKMRYCQQKIKLLNARKQMHNLNKQLDARTKKCERLESELHLFSRSQSKLDAQLAQTRQHAHSQASLVADLRLKCKSLQSELDETREEKESLEKTLKETRQEDKTFEPEISKTPQTKKSPLREILSDTPAVTRFPDIFMKCDVLKEIEPSKYV